MLLHITLLQNTLVWEDPAANREQFAERLAHIDDTDVVVLPEMFTTGFSMAAATYAEDANNGPTLKWMKHQAERHQTVLVGSIMVKEAGLYYNRLYWVQPDGRVVHYDKKHLFSMAKEHEVYTPGNQRVIIEYKGWRIAPFICYDLRFPAWNRNVRNYDLAIYVANWPSARAHHWRSLLTARAIENLAYIAAVNRVGTDEKGHHYSGDSSIIGPSGHLLAYQSHSEGVLRATLDREYLLATRKKFPFLMDRDGFEFL